VVGGGGGRWEDGRSEMGGEEGNLGYEVVESPSAFSSSE